MSDGEGPGTSEGPSEPSRAVIQPGEATEAEWQRLDPRMMLVHPIREVIRFLPAVIGLVVAGAASDNGSGWLQLLAVAIPVALGLARYLTTRYRIHDGRVELRRGVVSTSVLTAAIDRVRTVDLTASPVQRVLGLTTVRIGTGTAAKLGDDGLDLDGLPTARARELRARLLHSIARPADHAVPADDFPDQAPTGGWSGERLVARFDPGWLRYAPFTSAGIVALAGVIGVGFQVLSEVGTIGRLEDDPAAVVLGVGSAAALLGVVLAIAALVAVFSVLGYLVTNGNFALSHTTPDGSWHVRRGLLTTRETSLDDDRLRGVAIGEPLGLRLVRGGRLSAIVTGLDRSESGSAALLPPTPRALVDSVAAEVVGTRLPVHTPLVDHGPAARRRRWTRALTAALAVAAVPVAIALIVDRPWLALLGGVPLVAGVVLAQDRARGLGHALTENWLVARSGSLTRRRELLAADAVIGWNLHRSWFQRRAGLVTLVATTAGGDQSVTVPDVPEGIAVELAAAAVPGLIDPWLVQQSPRSMSRHSSSPPRR